MEMSSSNECEDDIFVENKAYMMVDKGITSTVKSQHSFKNNLWF